MNSLTLSWGKEMSNNSEVDLCVSVYMRIKTFLKQKDKYPENVCEILAAQATNSFMSRTQTIKNEKRKLKLADSPEMKKIIDHAIKTIPGLSDSVIKMYLNIKLYVKQQTTYSMNKCEYLAADVLGSIMKRTANEGLDESAFAEFLANKHPSEYLDISELI